MPLGQLAQVLRDGGIDSEGVSGSNGRLLVGPETLDDAGVVLLGESDGVPGPGVALVQTVDFFPPVIDDPYLYGAVAAANSMSDVYAMGGRPISVLNLAGFPVEFDPLWAREILRGGSDKVREAGAVIAGGHTVQHNEPLFGYAVTGVVDRESIRDNSGARVGDRVYLTKPLGMGSVTTGCKTRKADPETVLAGARVMATLNASAAEAMNAAGAHACTDVTGFGVVGHGRNVAASSGVCLRLEVESLPLFPGAHELARAGVVSGSSQRSRQALGDQVRVAAGADAARVDICFDAETSGGLLIFIAAADAGRLEEELATRDVPVHAVGEVGERGDHLVELV